MEHNCMGHRGWDPSSQKSQGHNDSQQGLQDFLHWAYIPNLPATALLALEIKFKKGLYLQHEGCDTDVNYDLSQLGYQGAAIPNFLSTLKRKASGMPTTLNSPQMSELQ